MKNPFENAAGKPQRTPTERSFTERIAELPRRRIIQAMLMLVELPSASACAASIDIGRGPLSEIHEGEHPEADAALPSYEEMLKELKGSMGEDMVSVTMQMHQEYARTAQHRTMRTKLEGFRNLDVSDEAVRKYLSRRYPRAWLSQTGRIAVNPHLVTINYPGFDNKPEFGHCERHMDGGPIGIEFTSKDLKETEKIQELQVGKAMEALQHEVAHAVDWSSNGSLDEKQSLTLMYQAWHASADPGRPKFSYPESIKAQSPEKRPAMAYGRMTEFFAELMSNAMDVENGDTWDEWEHAVARMLVNDFKAEPKSAEKDARFVREFFEWTAPGFKPWEAARKDVDWLAELQAEHEYRRLTLDVAHVSDTKIKHALSEALAATDFSVDDAYYQLKKVGGLDLSPGRRYSGELPFFDSLDTDIQKNRSISDCISSLNGIISAVVSARLNFSRRTEGLPKRTRFDVLLGNATVEHFNAMFAKVPPEKQDQVRALLVDYVRQSTLKAPPPRP